MNLALAATKALKSTPLLVLVTGRPDIFSVFGDLVTTRGLTHVELGPLGKRASIRLLQNLLEDKSAESVERVAQQAGGNPFLLEELARAVAQGRGKELPETVLATAQARLETLSPSLRRVLRAAAVLGDSITEEGVGALLVDLGADERRERLRELVHEEILESDPSEPGRYWFHQVVLREASYASLTEADKKLAHALAAQWLTARGGADPLTLATHHERADQRLEAIEYLLASAEQSLEGQDFEGALVRLTRAASAGAEGPRLGRIWLLRSEANRWLGKTEQMRECSVQAARLLPEGNRLWLAAKANEAHAAMQLGDTKPAESLAVLLALLVEGGDKTAQVISAAARVAANLVRYRVTAPATRLLGALSIAVQGCTDEGAVGRVWEALATDAAFRNEAEDALELYESAYQNFTRANDVRSACTTRLNQAYSLMQVGQSARASTLLREMLALAERNGLATLRSLALHNLGMALAEEGHLVEGEQVEREAWRMYVEQKSKRLTAACRYYLGRILMMRGMHADAEAEMTHACADAEGLPSLVPLMLAGLALAQLAAGKRVEALATARDAERRTTEREGRVESPELVKLALAEALAANDQRADAAKVLRQLTSELEIQSQRLRDPELRRSFLENAPDNARAFALQAKLDGTPAR
jgi:tetratricopeptide (TPR) repeat protein